MPAMTASIRVLSIARYRDATMARKLSLMAQQPGVEVLHIAPRNWQDEWVKVEQRSFSDDHLSRLAIAIYRPADPHRAIYRTLGFGLASFNPDIIHAEEEPDSIPALQIALARRLFAPRARLVFHTWQNVARPMAAYVRWIMRATLNASDAVLCANREGVDLLRHWGYVKPLQVIPPIGVDTRVFAPAASSTAPANGAAVGQHVITYMGRLVPEKGIDVLIEAFRLLRSQTQAPAELSLVGAGPVQAGLQAQIDAAGLSACARILPPVPPAQVPACLHAAAVLVLPSRTTAVWKEQFGRVLTEAMACKVPVVGSDSGAIPEVIGDAGLIFPEGDAAALAERLQRLVESDDLRHDLAGRGYQRVMQHYTQEHVAEQTVSFYRQLLSGAAESRDGGRPAGGPQA